MTDSLGQHPKEILNYHNDDDLGNYVEDVIRKYRSHQSIAKIKETVDVGDSFMFHKVSVMDVKTRLKRLNIKKAAGYDIICCVHRRITDQTKILWCRLNVILVIRFLVRSTMLTILFLYVLLYEL